MSAEEATPHDPFPKLCGCGHRLGIHEFPNRCMGAMSWPDDNVTQCECTRGFTFEQITTDRERFPNER